MGRTTLINGETIRGPATTGDLSIWAVLWQRAEARSQLSLDMLKPQIRHRASKHT
jgi:hypothetical protein